MQGVGWMTSIQSLPTSYDIQWCTISEYTNAVAMRYTRELSYIVITPK